MTDHEGFSADLPTVDLAIIGGGNMGAALLGGILASGSFTGDRLAVVELLESRRDELVRSFAGVDIVEVVPPCRSAVIAVKPADVPAAARVASEAGARRLLSIAAGVRIVTIEGAVGRNDVAVVRAMPNTAALVGEGVAAIAAGSSANAADVGWAESILGSVGTVEHVAEEFLDAFTGVAGSGPAYVFLVAESLTDAAVAAGLERSMAARVVRQLLVGAAALLARDGDPVRLRAQVTSPGGTTAAGIESLEASGLRRAFVEAVEAATTRSRELG